MHTRLGNLALKDCCKSLRGQSCLGQLAQKTMKGAEGPEGHRPLSPFPGSGIRAPSPLQDTYLLPGLPFHHICTADTWNIKMLAGGWGQMQGSSDCKSCCLPPTP